MWHINFLLLLLIVLDIWIWYSIILRKNYDLIHELLWPTIFLILIFFSEKIVKYALFQHIVRGRIIMFHPPPPKIWTGTGNLQRPNVKWSSFGKPMRFSLPALSGKEIGGKKHLTLPSSRIVPTLSQGGNVLSPIHVIICSLQKYLGF